MISERPVARDVVPDSDNLLCMPSNQTVKLHWHCGWQKKVEKQVLFYLSFQTAVVGASKK